MNDPYPAPCDPPKVACGGGNGDAFFEKLVSIIYERGFVGSYERARTLSHRTVVHRCIATATTTANCLLRFPSFVFCQALLQFRRRLELWLLRLATYWIRCTSWSRIPCGCSTFGLGLVEPCNDSLVVCLRDLCRDTFHTKYLDFKSLSIGQGIVHAGQGLLVDLVHVDGQAYVVSKEFMRGLLRGSPPAVFSLRPHLSHLKCLAF